MWKDGGKLEQIQLEKIASCNTIEVLKIIRWIDKIDQTNSLCFKTREVSRYDLKIRKLGTREKKKAKVFYTKDNKHME